MTNQTRPKDYIELDNIPTMIIPLILFKMENHLTVKLQDEVPDTDPTKAVIVKVGRFQDNPVKNNVSVSLSSGDYEDPSYMDARADHENLKQFVVKNLPVGEIGGGMYWWRRFTSDVKVFFVKQRLDIEIGMRYAYEFYGRLLRATENCPTTNLHDDFGEHTCIKPFIEGSSFYQSGGSNQFNWRGKIKWRILTWRH